ncbi:hypothetical protein I4U23_022609 [Adineta vaga]|nr:hypothetical protein I4U23_022609 [Adineta vaga]
MEKHATKSKNYAFFCPQGTLLLKDYLYVRRQGSTAENGGQVIYAVEISRALGQLGHRVDIYARNYNNIDFEMPHQIMIEIMSDCSSVRIIHVPTLADGKIEKEHFYPYYCEYLARAFDIIKDNDYDYIIGHYADGMFMAVVVKEMMLQHDGRYRTTFGITHSLALEKADCLLTKIKAEERLSNMTNKDIHLSKVYRQAIEASNLTCRFQCELTAMKRLNGIIPVSHVHAIMLCDKYHYAKDRIQIIPGGFDQNRFHSFNYTVEEKYLKRINLIQDHIGIIGKRHQQIIQNGKIVLGFGRFVFAKGIIEAVKSMRHLIRDIPQAIYVYIGGNIPPRTTEEKAVYQQSFDYARQHGFDDRIFFLGHGTQKMINAWLNVSDIYLHAAHLEPFGLAIQEAAATHIPIVMSQRAGACDILKDNVHVLYADPLQPEDIAKQVKRLLENKHLAERFAERAKEKVLRESTWLDRARTVDKFCTEIDSQLLLNHVDTTDIQAPFDDAMRGLLFHKSDKLIPECMRHIYHQVQAIMKNMLSNRLG